MALWSRLSGANAAADPLKLAAQRSVPASAEDDEESTEQHFIGTPSPRVSFSDPAGTMRSADALKLTTEVDKAVQVSPPPVDALQEPAEGCITRPPLCSEQPPPVMEPSFKERRAVQREDPSADELQPTMHYWRPHILSGDGSQVSFRRKLQELEEKFCCQQQTAESQTRRLVQMMLEPVESKISGMEVRQPLLDWKVSELGMSMQSLRAELKSFLEWKRTIEMGLQDKFIETVREIKSELSGLVESEVTAQLKQRNKASAFRLPEETPGDCSQQCSPIAASFSSAPHGGTDLVPALEALKAQVQLDIAKAADAQRQELTAMMEQAAHSSRAEAASDVQSLRREMESLQSAMSKQPAAKEAKAEESGHSGGHAEDPCFAQLSDSTRESFEGDQLSLIVPADRTPRSSNQVQEAEPGNDHSPERTLRVDLSDLEDFTRLQENVQAIQQTVVVLESAVARLSSSCELISGEESQNSKDGPASDSSSKATLVAATLQDHSQACQDAEQASATVAEKIEALEKKSAEQERQRRDDEQPPSEDPGAAEEAAEEQSMRMLEPHDEVRAEAHGRQDVARPRERQADELIAELRAKVEATERDLGDRYAALVEDREALRSEEVALARVQALRVEEEQAYQALVASRRVLERKREEAAVASDKARMESGLQRVAAIGEARAAPQENFQTFELETATKLVAAVADKEAMQTRGDAAVAQEPEHSSSEDTEKSLDDGPEHTSAEEKLNRELGSHAGASCEQKADVGEAKAVRQEQLQTSDAFREKALRTGEELSLAGGQGDKSEKQREHEVLTKPDCLFSTGMMLQYCDSKDRGWIDCQVMAVRKEDGAVQIDLSEKRWLSADEQQLCLRRSRFEDGQRVQCFSAGAWSDSVVTAVRSDGAVQLDVYKDRWFTFNEQKTLLRNPSKKVFLVGSRVAVIQNFNADSEEEQLLQVGEQGWITKIDDEGDALIDFDDHATSQWVCRAHFDKLVVVAEEAPREVLEKEKEKEKQTQAVAQGNGTLGSKRRLPQGLRLQYNSASQGKWVDCKVIAVADADGAVKVDVKPGYWFSMEEQAQKFRLKPYEVGQAVLYGSPEEGERTKAKVVAVRKEDGALQVDVRPGKWLTCDQQMEKLCPDEPQQAIRVGDLVCIDRDLVSDSAEPVKCLQGQQGRVTQIDEDGDALIDFDAHSRFQWVTSSKFERLRVLHSGDGQGSSVTSQAHADADFAKFTVKELKDMIRKHGASYTDCFSKKDLIKRAREASDSARASRDAVGSERRASFSDGTRPGEGGASQSAPSVEAPSTNGEASGHDDVSLSAVKRRGSVIAITEDFVSDSLDCTQLMKNQCGVVKDIDEEGDILVEFGGSEPQWIFSDNFKKLKVLQESGEGKEGAAPSAERERSKEARSRELKVGSEVIVKRDFQSDSAERVLLRTSQAGHVKRVDADGDALIDFKGLQKPHWVFKAALDNLYILPAKPEETMADEALKDLIQEAGLSWQDCASKKELLARAQEATQRMARPAWNCGNSAASSTAGSNGQGHAAISPEGVSDGKTICIGARVSVTHDFLSDSEQPVRLRQGQRGVVKDVDSEGDVLVDFEALTSHQWIFKPNLEKLTVLKDSRQE